MVSQLARLHDYDIETSADNLSVTVGLPDVRGRVAILKHHMGEVAYDVDVDASIIARGCPGMSGADLQNLVNQVSLPILCSSSPKA